MSAPDDEGPVKGVDVCDHGVGWDEDCPDCELEQDVEDEALFCYYCADCGVNFDDALNDGRLLCLVCGGRVVEWVA